MSTYPRKCWYVAATVDEVTGAPLARRILGADVVLWRAGSGEIAAFENRCAHRAFPLSHSLIDGDQLVCGYHGCTYDTEGRCTAYPVAGTGPDGDASAGVPDRRGAAVRLDLGRAAQCGRPEPAADRALGQRPGVGDLRGFLAL